MSFPPVLLVEISHKAHLYWAGVCKHNTPFHSRYAYAKYFFLNVTSKLLEWHWKFKPSLYIEGTEPETGAGHALDMHKKMLMLLFWDIPREERASTLYSSAPLHCLMWCRHSDSIPQTTQQVAESWQLSDAWSTFQRWLMRMGRVGVLRLFRRSVLGNPIYGLYVLS